MSALHIKIRTESSLKTALSIPADLGIELAFDAYYKEVIRVAKDAAYKGCDRVTVEFRRTDGDVLLRSVTINGAVF